MELNILRPDELMRLPDYKFGERWIVGLADIITNDEQQYNICSAPLPEYCVIWEYLVHVVSTDNSMYHTSVRLGDKLPATDAEFYANELLFPQGDQKRIRRNLIIRP